MKKIQLTINTAYIGAAIITLGTVLVVWISEYSGLWINGIGYVANDFESYYYTAIPIEGEYTVKIDLSDLESNEGKVLFDDGENQIYVSKVVVHNNESNYEVYFRSSGNYSSGGATLVSGVDHVRNNNDLINNFQAVAQATYRNNTYKLHPSGSSGLTFRDGDEFGFHLFSPDKKIEVDLEKETMVEVTITNLYLNLWAEK